MTLMSIFNTTHRLSANRCATSIVPDYKRNIQLQSYLAKTIAQRSRYSQCHADQLDPTVHRAGNQPCGVGQGIRNETANTPASSYALSHTTTVVAPDCGQQSGGNYCAASMTRGHGYSASYMTSHQNEAILPCLGFKHPRIGFLPAQSLRLICTTLSINGEFTRIRKTASVVVREQWVQ